MNNLLWTLSRLKERFKGNFYLSEGVKRELVDRPLASKKFKFEALQVLKCIDDGILEVVENEKVNEIANEILELSNHCFKVQGHWLNLFHYGEISGIAACKVLRTNIFVVDERTTRLVIESPDKLIGILERTMHTKIEVDRENLNKFSEFTKDIQLIRSVELVTRAYELGFLDKYLLNIQNPKRTLLESILWGVKLDGCSVSKREIEKILEFEKT
ncbi:hypothetical protein KY360_06655 [Candidatus Woesearchaeota archaeon]|nr:hypothetical protein [Candidatus Woesearchaeota archaeon]